MSNARLGTLLDGTATPSQGVDDEKTEILSMPVRLRRAGRPAKPQKAACRLIRTRVTCAPKVQFAADSLLEGDGFEPSVPREEVGSEVSR
jgi:hypothetical protein